MLVKYNMSIFTTFNVMYMVFMGSIYHFYLLRMIIRILNTENAECSWRTWLSIQYLRTLSIKKYLTKLFRRYIEVHTAFDTNGFWQYILYKLSSSYLADICLGIVTDLVESFKNRKLRWTLTHECCDIVLF